MIWKLETGSSFIMRIVVQRVLESSVMVDSKCISSIHIGLLVLVGIENDDTIEDIEWLCGKIVRLRIFDDDNGVMNLSVNDIKGEILVVSQFTLHASTIKGNRPSYIKAAKPEIAIPIYDKFIDRLQVMTITRIKKGSFGAMMQVKLVNNGPVTIIIDSKKRE